MTADPLIWALIVIAPLTVAACLYLWRIYLSDERRPRSWLLLMLPVAGTAITIASLFIAYLAVRVQLPSLPPVPQSRTGVILAVLLLEGAPIYFALVLWRIRRKGPHPDLVDGDLP